MKKQTVSFLLSLVLLLSLFPPLTAAGADSGRSGANVTWTLDKAAGVLSFEGSGRMYVGYGADFDPDLNDPLWWRDGDAIREIRFAEGITSISANLFSMTHYASAGDLQRLRNVRRVTVPSGVGKIGGSAFEGCTRLDEITILNPACVIEATYDTLGVPGRTVVAGYPGSSAERYAAAFGYDFRAIGCADGSHVFDDAVITPADCEHEGVLERTCVLCGFKTREAIPKAHDYAVTDRMTRTVYTCTRCGDSYAVGESKRLRANEQTDFTVVAGACPSVCFTPEKTDRYILQIDQYEARTAYGYQQLEGVLCTADGQPVLETYGGVTLQAGQTYYYYFNQVYDDALRVLAYVFTSHDYREVSDTSTCTAPGVWTRVCSYCGDTDVAEVPPRGHEEVQTVVTAPTCTQEGLARYTCARCGESWTEPLPPAHQYRYDADLPWYQHGKCVLCGEERTRGTADPPALRLDETARTAFAGDLCAFRFTAGQEDVYWLRSDTRDGGLAGGLYTADGEPLHGSYSMGIVEPFFIVGKLDPGQSYYFVIARGDDGLPNFNVTVELRHEDLLEFTAPASCDAEGRITWTCVYCGRSYTEVIPEDHQWRYDVELPWYAHAECVLCGRQADFGTRTPPILSLGQTAQPEYDSEGSAFYRFTAETSDVYRFRFTASGGDSLSLYDTEGYPHWSADVDRSEGTVQAMIEAGETVYLQVSDEDENRIAPPLTAELFHRYIQITTREPSCTGTGTRVGMCRYCGDYITETLPPQHDYEYDVLLPWYWHAVCASCGQTGEGGVKDPPALQPDHSETVRIEDPDGEVFRRLTAEKDGVYRITVTGRDAGIDVRTAGGDSFNGRYYRENPSLLYYDAALAAGQSCYVGLGFWNKLLTGDIRVKVELLRIAGRTELLPDQRANVRLRGPEDAAFFSFTPEETGYYEFRTDAPLGIYPVLQLQDAGGNALNAYESPDGSSHRLWLEAGQTAEAVVRTYDDSSQSYSLLVRRVDSLFDAVALTPDRIETAVLRPYDDVAWFRFTPKETGSYEFASTSGEDAFCILCDAEGNELLHSNNGPFGTDFVLRETLEAGQTYFFQVMCSGSGQSRTIPVVLRRSRLWSSPYYNWLEDGQVAAHCFCLDDYNVVAEQTVYASRVITKAPTFTAPGEAVWIAVFDSEPFHTQTRTVYLPPLGADALPCDGTDCPGAVFADMPPKAHWSHDAIDWALVNDVTRGTSDTRFSPDAGCTRAQVATFLWRAAGQPLPGGTGNPFADVGDGAYYRQAVLWALGEGITTGASADRFRPDAVCTRAQIVTFLWRFAGSPEPETAAAYGDVAPGAYYEKAVAWAQENGVTTGTAAGRFSPDAACTRAQIVTFLYRTMN